MARTPEHIAPHIPHIPIPDIKGAARWALIHWKPIGLALATGLGGVYLALAHDRGPSAAPPVDNAPVSDTFKPPENPPEEPAPAISAPVEQVQPSDEAKIAPQKPETLKPFDCSILSPETCATAQRLNLIDENGKVFEAMGFILTPGEPLKISIPMQVAKTEIRQPSWFHGNRAIAKSMDGKLTLQLSGDIVFDNMRTENKDSGAVFATAGNTGVKVFDGFDYKLVLVMNDDTLRRQMFGERVDMPATVILYKVSGQPATKATPRFFDIPPPK